MNEYTRSVSKINNRQKYKKLLTDFFHISANKNNSNI